MQALDEEEIFVKLFCLGTYVGQSKICKRGIYLVAVVAAVSTITSKH